MLIHVALASFALLFAQDDPTESGHWPGFRGYQAGGVAEGFEMPVEWDVEEGTNVHWRVALRGLAHSSPVVWGKRVFVTTAVREAGEAELSSLYGSEGYGAGDSVEDEGSHHFKLLCLDLETGKTLWERTAHTGVPTIKRHPKASHASSSPVCDARRVIAFFGSEGLYAYDHEGEPLWKKDLGVLDVGAPEYPDNAQYQWGFAASPTLIGERVIVQADIQAQSFLAAFDANTGAELWRTLREEGPTWCTPTAHGSMVIANGYKHVGGYDLETGKELWRLSGGGDVPVPTPVVAHDMVYITSAHGRQNPLYAVSLEASGTLELSEDEEAIPWLHMRRGTYMQTPLAYGEELYACSDGGILGCYDAYTGEALYRERLGGGGTGFSGSGVASDGKLYYSGESGEIFVVAAGPVFELLAVNDMGETCMSTPAIADGRLLIRTRGHLTCIGVD